MKTPGCAQNRVDIAVRVIRQLNFPATSLHKIFGSTFPVRQNSGKVVIAMLLIALAFSSPALAQDEPGHPHLGPFEEQSRTNNPLREPFNINFRPTPAAIDIDADGDTDVMVADFDGGNGFHLFRNDGSASAPAFNPARYSDNPFEYISFDDGATPTFTDLDNDGDDDMLLGVLDGTFRYYQKTPTFLPYTLQSGSWDPVTKVGNPFHGIDLGDYASPVFIDMDNDGDDDVVVGTSYAPHNKSLYYYVNDGAGVFTPGTLTGVDPVLDETTPAFADVDGDGDKDLILGAADGNLYYYKRTGQTTFEEQTGANNPFFGLNKGARSSPTAADLDNDGDDDLMFGAESNLNDIFYLENKGNSVFEERHGFDNPFGGVDVSSDASPLFADVDNDGDDDLILGSSGITLTYYENVNGSFDVRYGATSPFNDLTIPTSFSPGFVDLDGDGDKDLVGGVGEEFVSLAYFVNEGGVFTQQSFSESVFSHIAIEAGNTDFADIDNDGDFDLFITENVSADWDGEYIVRFYRNTGTPQSPVFTEVTGTDNPLAQVVEEFEIYPRFIDVDHDGDFDALIGESGTTVEISDGNEFSYYENTGTKTSPQFTYRGDLIPQGSNPYSPAPAFTDYDGDGDRDIFFGNAAGQVSFYVNVNPPAEIALNATPLDTELGSGPALIDDMLVLSDEDSDSIVHATVAIVGHEQGKTFLTFLASTNITGSFDAQTGLLTLNGKAPIADYQALLRAVAFEYVEENEAGRGKETQGTIVSKVITIYVRDADGTYGSPGSRTINVVSGSSPVFSDLSVTINANSIFQTDLAPLITDADGDLDFGSLMIIQPPASGASASVSNDATLLLDYTGVNFAGTETLSLTVCDEAGSCDEATITITVTNTAPVFNNHSVNVPFGQTITLDLKTLIVDNENNGDLTTLSVVNELASGALPTINATGILTLSYNNIAFAGTETLHLQVCDQTGSCDGASITLTVTNTAPVVNNHSVNISFGQSTAVDLKTLVSDAESNVNYSTFAVMNVLPSGAATNIDNNAILTVSYNNLTFAGTETLQLQVCDVTGACHTGELSITVTNNSPVIQPPLLNTTTGLTSTVNLVDISSDLDGNLDLTAFEIINQPSSGALASIVEITPNEVNLVIDYSNITFVGTDQLTIRACDNAGACVESVITIEVSGISSEIEVFNAVSPNSVADNRYMRITNLPASNKVTILNRWGDVVFQVQNYDHETPGRRFEGLSNNGKTLSSGTYFYTIEFFDTEENRKTLTGYLALKH